jgi:hypothetical protein
MPVPTRNTSTYGKYAPTFSAVTPEASAIAPSGPTAWRIAITLSTSAALPVPGPLVHTTSMYDIASAAARPRASPSTSRWYLTAAPDGSPTISYRQDRAAWTQLSRTLLGKNLIFTDHDDWTNAQIVSGYRSQHHVESDFRRLKNPHHLAFRPTYHWTDQKLRVHAFTCVLGVLALLLCSLLRRTLHHAGISLSVEQLLDELGGIREVTNLYESAPQSRKPVVTRTLSRLSVTQRQIYDLLQLDRYRAR